MRYQSQLLRYLVWFVLAQSACATGAVGVYFGAALSLLAQRAGTQIAHGLIVPLLYIAGCTLLLSVAMLTIVPFVFLTRIFEQFGQRQEQSDSQALRHIHTVVRTRDAIIFGLAKLAESRDDETGQHLDRVAAYAACLAMAASTHPQYRQEVTEEFLELLRLSVPLHDIGKVGIPDAILLKPGPLTPAERSQMEEHVAIGARCLQEIERRLGDSDFLQIARAIILSHHERWDGSGYPTGLAGGAIPLAARITAIADVYDALSSRRAYRAALAHPQCVAIISGEAGTHFDPDLVEIFLKVEPRFREIALMFGADNEDSDQPPLSFAAIPLRKENDPCSADWSGQTLLSN